MIMRWYLNAYWGDFVTPMMDSFAVHHRNSSVISTSGGEATHHWNSGAIPASNGFVILMINRFTIYII